MRDPLPSPAQERVLMELAAGMMLWKDTMSGWFYLQGDPPDAVIPSNTIQALLDREWILTPHPEYADTVAVRYELTPLGLSALRKLGSRR